MELSITEAAAALSVSTQTIRRRLTNGVINGYKRATPQGFVWVVDLEGEPATTPPIDDSADVTLGADAVVVQMQARIDSLEAQLTTRAGEVDHLHQLLARTALNAAPTRPWWRFW